MEIYDIDKDLNKLLNEPGMNDALKKLRHAILWGRFGGYVPTAILVLGACCSLFFKDKAKNLIAIISIIFLCLIVSMLLLKLIDRKTRNKLYHSDYKISKIISIKCTGYNLEYLVYILNLRIQRSKHANDIYKKSIKLSLSLLGINVSYFIYSMIKYLFKDIKFNVYGVFEASAIITFLLLVVSLSFDIYDAFINNSIKAEKWQYLLKHVTKLELKSKKAKN